MKVIIPVAGLGSRLKPHTFTTPKPLMEVGGKPIIEYVIEDVKKLNPSEIVLIVGYKKELIEEYFRINHSDLNVKFVEQKVRDGDGSAVRIGLEEIEEDEELYIIFGADTLIDFDIRAEIAKNRDSDAVIFTQKVKEPSNYGIVNIEDNYEIYEMEEKPANPKSDLAVIGAYYFKSTQRVKSYLEDFHKRNETIKGEYKMAQVIQRLVEEKDISIKASVVKKWFDCGRVEVLLDANNYILEKLSKSKTSKLKGTSIIIPPSYVHSSVKLENCVIGPYVSIGKNCSLKDVAVKRSIINPNSILKNIVLSDSLIGKEVILKDKAKKLNIGDRSEIYLE